MRYLSADEVLELHIYLMNERWNERFYGLRDRALLESAVDRPANAEFYGDSDVFELAAKLWESLSSNHPFLQGNKRTAYGAVMMFLRLNGWRCVASGEERISISFALAQRQVGVAEAAQWLREHSINA